MVSMDEAMGICDMSDKFPTAIHSMSTLSVARFDKPLIMTERGKI